MIWIVLSSGACEEPKKPYFARGAQDAYDKILKTNLTTTDSMPSERYHSKQMQQKHKF